MLLPSSYLQAADTAERNQSDWLYKQMCGNPLIMAAVLQYILSAELFRALDLPSLRRYPDSYITADRRERRDDLVWKVRWRDGPWCYLIIIMEFQSRSDRWMALRMASYVALQGLDLVKRGEVKAGEPLPTILPLVIYNGSAPWRAPTALADLCGPRPDELRPYGLNLRYLLLDVNAVSADASSQADNPALLFMRLDRARDPAEIISLVKRLTAAVRAPEAEELRRVLAAWLRQVVLTRPGVPAAMRQPREELEEVCTMLAENLDRWEAGLIQKGEAKGKAEGLAKGKAEGLAKGLAEGEAKGFKTALRSTVEWRFGQLPPEVATYVDGSRDVTLLQRLHQSLLEADSLSAFMAKFRALAPQT